MLRAVRSFTESTSLRIAGQTALALSLIAILAFLRLPVLKQAAGTTQKNDTHSSHLLPIRGQRGQKVQAALRIGFAPMQSTLLRFRSETCLSDVTMNGKPFPRICPMHVENDIDFGPYLSVGDNILRFTLVPAAAQSAYMDLYPSPADPMLTALFFIAAAIAILCIVALYRRHTRDSGHTLAGVFAFGVLLRFLYVSVTPPGVRSYDLSGHLDYIRFLLTHHSIPMLGQGWETHQPPLYYALAAGVTKAARLFSWSETQSVTAVQYLSLIFSVCTLAIGLWIGRRLFRGPEQQRAGVTFAAILAVFPGLVMVSSRISNDALYQLTAFAFIACLIVWWEKGTTKSLIAGAIMLGIGMLTKENTFLLVAAFFACILVRPGAGIRRKLSWLTLGFGVIALVAGWLIAMRILNEGLVKHFAYEAYALNAGLRIHHSISSLFVFTPDSVFQNPYVSTWNDDTGRQFFWIFFFKSAFFGEFAYANPLLATSRILVILGMGMVPIAGFAVIEGIRKRERFLAPLLITAVLCVLGVITYRVSQPYSCNQDFRFALPVIIPFAYLAALAVRTPFDITRDVFMIWCGMFVFMCAAFVTGVAFVS